MDTMFGKPEKPGRTPDSDDLIESYDDLLDRLRQLPESESPFDRSAREDIAFAILKAIYQLEEGAPCSPFYGLGLRRRVNMLKLDRLPLAQKTPQKSKRRDTPDAAKHKNVPAFGVRPRTSYTLSRMSRMKSRLRPDSASELPSISPPMRLPAEWRKSRTATNAWEYCWLAADFEELRYNVIYGEAEGEHDRREVAAFLSEHQMQDDLMRMIAQLGEAGWELVTQDQQSTRTRYTFKRLL